MSQRPLLSGLVVHWRDEDGLASLFSAWPDDPRFELVVVDNGSVRAWEPPFGVVVVRPGRNLGFAGAANLGAGIARADLLLLLNPDAAPAAGALDALLAGFDELPEAAGLAPRLVGPEGEPQRAWQLKPLPRPRELVLHGFFFDPRRGPEEEPPPGAGVEQPAAAALALRREAWEAVGGLDSRFHPAWFEDVDLARRLADHGLALRYWPAAEVVHAGGATVPALGYRRFLLVYDRGLARYLAKHHGRGWAAAARAAIVSGSLARLALLPWRRPARARTRGEAARALLAAAGAAITGWRQRAPSP